MGMLDSGLAPSSSRWPAAGDNSVAFLVVVDAVGADGGAPPEDLLVALRHEDGVVAGAGAHSADVLGALGGLPGEVAGRVTHSADAEID